MKSSSQLILSVTRVNSRVTTEGVLISQKGKAYSNLMSSNVAQLLYTFLSFYKFDIAEALC